MLNIHQVPRLRRAVDPAPEIEGFDPVTGLPARELLYSRLGKQWDWSLKRKNPVSFVLLNLDHYRAYEQAVGREQADQTLGRIGDAIAQSCRRRADMAGRTREGEFGVMLADCEQPGAEKVAESIRHQLNDMAVAYPQAPGGKLTVSVGGTCRVPTPSRFQNSLVIEADQALKEAKAEGRNCIRFS